jgi:hypothetical protein
MRHPTLSAAMLAVLAALAANSASAERDAARQPLTAAQYLEQSYATMRDFGRCAVLQERLAEVLKSAGAEANAEELRGVARGARTIASLGTVVGSTIGDADAPSAEETRAEAQRIATNEASLKSITELEVVRQRAFTERGELDKELMGFCARLNPIQAELIEHLRAGGLFGS